MKEIDTAFLEIQVYKDFVHWIFTIVSMIIGLWFRFRSCQVPNHRPRSAENSTKPQSLFGSGSYSRCTLHLPGTAANRRENFTIHIFSLSRRRTHPLVPNRANGSQLLRVENLCGAQRQVSVKLGLALWHRFNVWRGRCFVERGGRTMWVDKEATHGKDGNNSTFNNRSNRIM